jgi:hypothetical protein
MVEILVLIRGERESRDKAEQMFVAIENLELRMQAFVGDFNKLESVAKRQEPRGIMKRRRRRNRSRNR